MLKLYIFVICQNTGLQFIVNKIASSAHPTLTCYDHFSTVRKMIKFNTWQNNCNNWK